jgi:hypothetical protein
MPRYKKTDRQEIMGQTRQLLLQAATVEFAREGYAGANIFSTRATQFVFQPTWEYNRKKGNP